MFELTINEWLLFLLWWWLFDILNIAMSNNSNPYAKFITDPSKIPNPNNITLTQLEKYNSLEIEKLNSLFRTLKRSSLYIGGVVGLCLVGAWWAEKKARCDLFGSDSKFITKQIREEVIWIWWLSEMRSTMLTTDSSNACSTWQKDLLEILPHTVISCWPIWELHFQLMEHPKLPRDQPMKNIIDSLK